MKILSGGTVPNGLLNFRSDLIQDIKKRGHEVIASSSMLDSDSIIYMNKLGIKYESIYLNRHSLSLLGDLRTLTNVLSSVYNKRSKKY